MNPKVLRHAKEELLDVLLAVKRKAAHQPKKAKMRPPKTIVSLLASIQQEPTSVGNQLETRLIRQIHNFYGWKAKDTRDALGVCSGAVYRSEGYLTVSPNDRSGKQKEGNVHIEHTVPVNCLLCAIRQERDSFKSSMQLHKFLMRHSVCTALHKSERKNLQHHDILNCREALFTKSDRVIGEYPFARYQSMRDKLRVYNIFTGKEINFSAFTFKDHQQALSGLSELSGNSEHCDRSIFDHDAFTENELNECCKICIPK